MNRNYVFPKVFTQEALSNDLPKFQDGKDSKVMSPSENTLRAHHLNLTSQNKMSQK